MHTALLMLALSGSLVGQTPPPTPPPPDAAPEAAEATPADPYAVGRTLVAELKDGQTVRGLILKRTGDLITLRKQDGQRATFSVSEVARVLPSPKPKAAGPADPFTVGTTLTLELKDGRTVHGQIVERHGNLLSVQQDAGAVALVHAEDISRATLPEGQTYTMEGRTTFEPSAADTSPVQTVMSLSPLALLGVFTVEVDHAISPSVSLYAGGTLGLLQVGILSPSYALQAGLRAFPQARAPTGFFLDFHADTSAYKAGGLLGAFSFSGLGAMAGFTGVISHVALSLGVGIEVGSTGSTSFTPVAVPAVRVMIGYAF